MPDQEVITEADRAERRRRVEDAVHSNEMEGLHVNVDTLAEETGILRNLIGARTRKSLEDTEGSLSFTRLVQLMDHPARPTGDLGELRAVHRHLFQDLYYWAGSCAPSISARTSRAPRSSCPRG